MSDKVLDALEFLSGSKSHSELVEGHRVVQSGIKAKRAGQKKAYGVLAQTYAEAMEQWANQKAEGVSLEDRQRNLEGILRASWPPGREWKYLCQNCNDLGAVWSDCPGDASCGRTKEHYAHSYVTPCWCSEGARYKPKQKTAEDFTEAGRGRSMTRVGRR